MIYSFDYDGSYFPAMPTVEVEIRQAQNAPGLTLWTIVDSGADATIIPIAYLEEIGALKGGEAWLRGTARSRQQVELFWVWLSIGALRAIYLEVVADELGDEAILGRDVLNQFVATLNGPASMVEIAE